MVSREEFLQLKSAVQELRSEMRKLQVDVLQRLTKLEDQLEASSLNAPPEPVLTCVQCGLEYGESSNTDGCRYHSGRFLDYPTYYECCKKGYSGSDLPPGCRKGRHRNKHHGDYPYENYFKYMQEQSNNAKEIWMEMDLLDPLVKSCMWSEVGLTQDDFLYILLGAESTMPTAFLEYTMEELTQCELSHNIALDKTGSSGWSLKVEIQSVSSIATSICITLTSSYSPHHLLTKELELLFEGGAFKPGHVTCLSAPNDFFDHTLPESSDHTLHHPNTNPLPEATYEGPQLEIVDYSKERKNDYECVRTKDCPLVLRQHGHTSVSSTRRLANGKWNNLFTAVLSVTNQSSIGMAAREVFGEYLSKDGTTWIHCEQVFLAKEVLLEGGRSQEWVETTDFYIEPTSTTTWRVTLAIQFADNPPNNYHDARKAHPSLPQPLHLRVTFVDHDNMTTSLRLEQGNPPLDVPTRQSRQNKFCSGKPIMFYIFADDTTNQDRSDVFIYYDDDGVLTSTTSLSSGAYRSHHLVMSKLLCLAARAKQGNREESVMEEMCFENSTASVKGYLVTDLESGLPYAVKVCIKTTTSSATGYCPLPCDVIGSPTLSVDPQQALVGNELTVQWALNRVSSHDTIGIYSLYGKSCLSYEYNTKAEASGTMTMKAPDTPGMYQIRYYPKWLDNQYTMYRHSVYVAIATFEVTVW